MNANQLHKVLMDESLGNAPIMVWGAPGVGKSDVINNVGHERYGRVWDVRLPLLDQIDLRGYPVVKDDVTVWLPPDFLPKPQDGPGILFLDEINAAPPSVQASAYQLILNRRVGEYVLPDDVRIIAAGNRRQDKAVTHKMPSPLRSRFLTHITLDVDLDAWIQWGMANDIHPDVLGFVKQSYGSQASTERPEWPLFDFSQTDVDESFPTPRTWTFVSKLMGVSDPSLKWELIAGTIGKATSDQFSIFISTLRDLPSVDEVLIHGRIPQLDRVDHKFAYVMRLATQANVSDLANVIKYANSLGSEFGVLLIKSIGERGSELYDSLFSADGGLDWFERHADLIVSD